MVYDKNFLPSSFHFFSFLLFFLTFLLRDFLLKGKSQRLTSQARRVRRICDKNSKTSWVLVWDLIARLLLDTHKLFPLLFFATLKKPRRLKLLGEKRNVWEKKREMKIHTKTSVEFSSDVVYLFATFAFSYSFLSPKNPF